jgi:hypothetical protein
MQLFRHVLHPIIYYITKSRHWNIPTYEFSDQNVVYIYNSQNKVLYVSQNYIWFDSPNE